MEEFKNLLEQLEQKYKNTLENAIEEAFMRGVLWQQGKATHDVYGEELKSVLDKYEIR